MNSRSPFFVVKKTQALFILEILRLAGYILPDNVLFELQQKGNVG